MSWVWLTDQLVPADEARIPVDDWGFLYGDTLFETIRVVAGRPLAWPEHMTRLFRSARRLNYSLPWGPDDLLDAIGATLAANGLADAAARVTVTRGRNPTGLDLHCSERPQLVVTVRPYAGPPEEELRAGIAAEMVRVARREGHTAFRYQAKSGNYLEFLLALDRATSARAREAILVDGAGRVLEGARSNVFVVRRGRVLTPPVRVGILPGVTRGLVVRWARAEGIPIRAEIVHHGIFRNVGEVFLTNSLWGILPVASMAGRQYSAPGPVTQRLMERWTRWMQSQARGR